MKNRLWIFSVLFFLVGITAQSAYIPYEVFSGSPKQRLEWVKVRFTGGNCVIQTQSGSWVSSCTRNGTGDGSINFAAGTFSSAGGCVCNAEQQGVYCYPFAVTEPTTSHYEFQITTFGGSPVDFEGVTVMCMGPR